MRVKAVGAGQSERGNLIRYGHTLSASRQTRAPLSAQATGEQQT